MSVRELLEAGERLGYEGDELRQFCSGTASSG